jgi:hypothetical protein
MALFRRDPEPLVAVARAVDPGARIELGSTAPDTWQAAAWRYWHDLGEIHYPTSQVARLVSRLQWTTEPEVDLQDAFTPPSLEEVARLVALNLQVAGDGWLIRTEFDKNGRRLDEARWEVLSVTTAKLKERTDRAEVSVRFWNPDPEDPSRADSAVRPALGPASELATLQAMSRAQSFSRIATAGLLLRPATKKPMLDDAGNPVDFGEMLAEAMTAAIADETSAAAVVPIDLELPVDEIEHWTHLVFERPYDNRVEQKMERAITRIALALDIWPELLLGVADVNHWNAWFLAEDTWQGHLAPVAEQVAGTLEAALAEVDVETQITPDPSELLAHRSSVRDALDAAEIGAVGLAYVRDVIGAEDEDAPTEDEIELILRMKGTAEPEEEPAVEENPGPPDTQEESQEVPIAAAAGDVESGLGVELARVDDQLRSWLEGAADVTVDLARNRVGMRVRTALRGDARLVVIDGVPNADVVAAVGLRTAEDLIDVPGVVAQNVEPLAARWERRLEAAEDQIRDLVGDVAPADSFALARKRSAEALVDDLTEQIIAGLERTDLPAVDLRRVVALAGLD